MEAGHPLLMGSGQLVSPRCGKGIRAVEVAGGGGCVGPLKPPPGLKPAQPRHVLGKNGLSVLSHHGDSRGHTLMGSADVSGLWTRGWEG